MDEMSERVEELQRMEFLRRMHIVTEGDTARWVPAGVLGSELALPYEVTLRIIDSLRAEGLVRRGGGGRLEPPFGPRIRLTEEGVRRIGEGEVEPEGA
jgi:hypothetical protein